MPATTTPLFAPASFLRFGDLLRFLRRRVQLSQRDLSIAVGYSFAQISRLEQGQRLPDPTVIAATFVKALGLDREPEWAARLVELAEEAQQERHDAALHAIVRLGEGEVPSVSAELKPLEPLEPIPDSVAHEVARLHLIARLHARLVAERRVALCGLAGMGKTTLAAALAREYAEMTPVFWLTFTTGVTTSVAVLIRQLAHFLLANGYMQIQPLLRPASQDHPSLPLDRQIALISAGLSWLAQSTSGRRAVPPMLCFDNVHLVQHDTHTIQVLRHLAATSPARLVLTSREVLRAMPGWAQVVLSGLEAIEGHELLGHLLGAPIPQQGVPLWADRLLERTGGSPMLLQLAIGQMLDQQVEPLQFIAQLDRQPQFASYLLETVGQQLSSAASELLALVSVFRQPINLHDPRLAELLQVTGHISNLGAPLTELIQRHLIHHPTRAQLHPLIRDYIYSGLLVQPVYRRQLHQIAAEWSAQELNDALEASYHFYQAGDLAGATAALVSNAEAMSRSGKAFVVADLAGEIVSQLQKRHRESSDLERQLLMLQGDMLIGTQRAGEAEASYRAALSLITTPVEQGQIVFRLAQSLTQRGRAAEAATLCQRASLALAPSEIVLRAQLSAAEAQAHVAGSNYLAAAEVATRSLALIDQFDPSQLRQAADVRVRVHRTLYLVMRARHQLDAALLHAQHAIAAAQEANKLELLLQCQLDELRVLWMRGKNSIVLRRSDELMPQFLMVGDTYSAGQLSSLIAMTNLRLSDLPASLVAAERAYSLRLEIGDLPGAVIAANHRALALIALDRVAEARSLIEATLLTEGLTSDMHEMGFTLSKLAMIQMLEGDPQTAQQTLHQALSLPATANHTHLRAELYGDLAMALVISGTAGQARLLLLEHPIESVLGFQFEYQLLDGLALLAAGDTETANQILAEVAANAQQAGNSLLARQARLFAQLMSPLPPISSWARLMWITAHTLPVV